MIQVKEFTFNHYATNCYLLYDEDSLECAIVDPCCQTEAEQNQLYSYISGHQLQAKFILLTHAHSDHVAGIRQVCEKYGLPVRLHREGVKMLHMVPMYAAAMGFDIPELNNTGEIYIAEGDVISLGNGKIECLEVPGHCPGSMAFVLHAEKMIITGDALFRGSIGRTDLPGGSLDQLLTSIREKILVLDDDYQVLPGHGDTSNVGDERNNPFIFNY